MRCNARALAHGVAAVGVILAGCATEFQKIAPTPPEHYARLGPATGRACGSLGILHVNFYFVPMYLNSRLERAYNNALASVPGAAGLVDVTIKEDWYWWVIGTARCVTISGEAIK